MVAQAADATSGCAEATGTGRLVLRVLSRSESTRGLAALARRKLCKP